MPGMGTKTKYTLLIVSPSLTDGISCILAWISGRAGPCLPPVLWLITEDLCSPHSLPVFSARQPSKGDGWAVGSGLARWHVTGGLKGELFTIPRNWPPLPVSETPRWESTKTQERHS